MKAEERQRAKEKHEVARALLFLLEIPEQDHVKRNQKHAALLLY